MRYFISQTHINHATGRPKSLKPEAFMNHQRVMDVLGLLVATEKTISRKGIYWKDELAPRTTRIAGGPNLGIGQKQRKLIAQTLGYRLSADCASGDTAPDPLPLPWGHCGPCGCWCWTPMLLVPWLPPERIILFLFSIPYCQWLLFLMGTWNEWALCTPESVPWPERMLRMEVAHLCSYCRQSRALPPQKTYTQGSSPNIGRASGQPKTWPMSTIVTKINFKSSDGVISRCLCGSVS